MFTNDVANEKKKVLFVLLPYGCGGPGGDDAGLRGRATKKPSNEFTPDDYVAVPAFTAATYPLLCLGPDSRQ